MTKNMLFEKLDTVYNKIVEYPWCLSIYKTMITVQ